jgi:hypothetical protein
VRVTKKMIEELDRVSEIVNRAMEWERERCAKIAEDCVCIAYEYNRGTCRCAEIARKIREG